MSANNIAGNMYIYKYTPLNYGGNSESNVESKSKKHDDNTQPQTNGLPPRETFHHLVHFYEMNKPQRSQEFEKFVTEQLKRPV